MTAKVHEKTHEQVARDMLERMGVNDAQSFTSGDVIELANLLARVDELQRELARLKKSNSGRK